MYHKIKCLLSPNPLISTSVDYFRHKSTHTPPLHSDTPSPPESASRPALNTPSPSPHTKTHHSPAQSPTLSIPRRKIFKPFRHNTNRFSKKTAILEQCVLYSCHVPIYSMLYQCKLVLKQCARQRLLEIPLHFYTSLIINHNFINKPIHNFFR